MVLLSVHLSVSRRYQLSQLLTNEQLRLLIYQVVAKGQVLILRAFIELARIPRNLEVGIGKNRTWSLQVDPLCRMIAHSYLVFTEGKNTNLASFFILNYLECFL